MSEQGTRPSSPIGSTATAALLVVYFLLALWGSEALGGRTASTTLIWPASGIGLALVLLRGARVWPLIFAAAFVSSALGFGTSPTLLAVIQALFSALASVLEPLVAAWLIWRVADEEFADRAGAFVLAMLVAVPVSALAAGAPLAMAELSAGGLAARAEMGFIAGWYSAAVADLMGMLALTPPLWIWARHPEIQVAPRRAFELVLFAAGVVVVFVLPDAAQARYLLVAIHLAISMRFPLKWASAAVALTSFAYLASAAFELRGAPSTDVYSLFLNNVGFAIILNLATYVTALLHGESNARGTRLAELANHLGEAEERERRRIAEVLHGDLQQLLVAAKMALPKDQGVERARARIDDSIKVARTLSTELHPPALSDRSFSAALEWLAWQTRELSGLKVHVDADERAEPGSEGLRAFLFQAVRELLMNVVKHADADQAWVRLRQSGEDLEIEVQDLGKGCNPGNFDHLSRHKSQHGASALRRRIELLGGRFDISTGRGCRITLIVPRLA